MTDASKIAASHRSRRCLVYVRQSTLAQTRADTESLERRYELAGRAVTLGWSPGQVQVVDADLGLSGAQAANREGFQELVAQVALGRVGLILGLEASRLARSNALFRYRNKAFCSAYGFMPRRAAPPWPGR
jgi:DNA invertase Pin-like site-specific DNA recombinase